MSLSPPNSRGITTLGSVTTITGTATAADVLTATSATAAHWAAGGGSQPFNGGTITDPLVIDVEETTTAFEVDLPDDPADTGIVLRTPAGRTDAHLIDAFSGADQTLEVRSTGGITVTNTTDGGNSLECLNAAGEVDFRVNGVNGSSNVLIQTEDAGVTGLVIVATDGEILRLESNTAAFRVTGEAAPVIALHSAPADASISAGEVALWFDQTNGAAKLMIKGKSADGTIVAGEVALT